jgi:hypothetical protein
MVKPGLVHFVTEFGRCAVNVSTMQQTMAAISAAEALRSDLIGRIDLHVVGDSGKVP